MINAVKAQIVHHKRVPKGTLKPIGYLKINVPMHMLTPMMIRRVLYDAVIQALTTIFFSVKL